MDRTRPIGVNPKDGSLIFAEDTEVLEEDLTAYDIEVLRNVLTKLFEPDGKDILIHKLCDMALESIKY